MTTLTVTATQGGGSNGMLLRVFVLTGAAAVSGQTGANTNNQFSGATAFTQSITTTAGSNVYGAASHGSGSSDTGSNATVVDSLDDSTNGWHYTTFKALNVTGAATTRGFTVSPANTGPFAQLEILASGTLAEDSSGPAAASTTAATTVTTASFTPPNSSLLVALVGSNGGAGVTTMTVTDNLGGHLNWTEKVKNNPSGGDYAGVWIADVPSGGTSANAGVASVTSTVTAPLAAIAALLQAAIVQAATTQPAMETGPFYATSAADLGGGTGAWVNPANATGAPDSTYATWAVP